MVDIPIFVLHQTGNCWWLYSKINSQYTKADVKSAPALKPGVLIDELIKDLGHDKFLIEILRS